jgi:hypothetical protein
MEEGRLKMRIAAESQVRNGVEQMFHGDGTAMATVAAQVGHICRKYGRVSHRRFGKLATDAQ